MARPTRQRASLWHRGYYKCACAGWRLVMSACARPKIEGMENLPDDGPYILVCNHISHFDPPTLAALLWRKHAWVVALDMYAHPVAAWFFRGIESIPVDRAASDRSAAKAILMRLRRGEPVGLFPEAGIRSGDASVLGGASFDETVGGLASLARVPLVPAVIFGTDKLYARRAWLRRPRIWVRIGVPIEPTGDRRDITKRAENAIRAVAEELKRAHGLSAMDMPMTAQERWRLELENRKGN